MRATHTFAFVSFLVLAGLAGAPCPARAQEDAVPSSVPFQVGDVLGMERIDAIRPYLPKEFWANRDYFFFDGMRIEIAGIHADFSPAKEYDAATERFRGQASIGPEGSLEGYTAGQPFPMEEIDCRGDPQAAVKIMWDFDYQWEGDGRNTSFLYSYWDRGERLPLFYEGHSRTIHLSHRVEPELLEKYDGDLFRGEKRKYAFGIEVTAPYESRGTTVLTYRYKSADGPVAQARNDDTWVYVPTLRRVRRISTAQRTDAVAGTDFTFDDLRSFSGIIPQYEWECLGEFELLAPMNSKVRAFPYDEDHDFGPLGVSFASDRWHLRHAVKVRMTPRNADHPYKYKDIYIDRQTLIPLYSFAYDQKQEMWKIIWHNTRWSEQEADYYPGWDGIETPRDLKTVSDIIVNIQTGTANRIEAWDVDGTPLRSKGQVRRYIDVGRLTQGR
jgi:hypothetical protein